MRRRRRGWSGWRARCCRAATARRRRAPPPHCDARWEARCLPRAAIHAPVARSEARRTSQRQSRRRPAPAGPGPSRSGRVQSSRSRRDAKEQRAAARFLPQRLLRALPKQRQLKLAHRSLHAEQQAIIGMPSIIDPVLVDDDGPDQSAELYQRMPVAAVAGEPGGFDRKYRPNAPLADRRQQPLEARPRDAAARAAEIVIDNLDGSPAELFGATGKTVLTPQALLVVHKLIGGRLADVDEGAAGEMVSRDLGDRRPPRPTAPPRSRAAALRPTLLIGRLADVDEGAAGEMVSRDL